MKRGTCDEDIKPRVAMRKRVTRSLHSVIWIKSISREAETNIFHSIIVNIITCGAEMWPLTNKYSIYGVIPYEKIIT